MTADFIKDALLVNGWDLKPKRYFAIAFQNRNDKAFK